MGRGKTIAIQGKLPKEEDRLEQNGGFVRWRGRLKLVDFLAVVNSVGGMAIEHSNQKRSDYNDGTNNGHFLTI